MAAIAGVCHHPGRVGETRSLVAIADNGRTRVKAELGAVVKVAGLNRDIGYNLPSPVVQ